MKRRAVPILEVRKRLAGGREGPRPFELAALFYLLTDAGEEVGTHARSCAPPAPSAAWSTGG